MKNKEFGIGEVFQFRDVKLMVCKRKKKASRCEGCFFYNSNLYCLDRDVWNITGECGNKREDKTDVIFVKVEE